MRAGRFAAVDLGASSGRVVVGSVGPGRLDLTEVHRFPNRPVRLPSGLHWDVLGLYGNVLDGLAAAGRAGVVDGIGVDTWAVDHGLLDRTGALLGNPYCYRDSRTDGVAEQVHARRSHAELYAENGLQLLPFNTIYQLAAAAGTPQLEAAERLLLVPDLVAHWLTGAVAAEVTNASTTGLLDVRTHRWSPSLAELVGVRPDLLPPLVRPGDVVGTLLATVAAETGLDPATPVTAVGSHDTASAVVAVPMDRATAAYVSLGTWGLVGVELDNPVLTEEGRRAGFTNELGVDGRIRYLRNVMGLWLLSECLRSWRAAGSPAELASLLAAAADLPPGGPVFDVADPRLLPPGDMPARVTACVAEAGHPPPRHRVAVVRCVVDSLAAALAEAVHDAARLSGRDVDVVHVVGGGSLNELLCQLTADAVGLPVVAGPVEATALGNVLVQARAAGVLRGSLEDLRALVRSTQVLRRVDPRVRRTA
jgi:rhamnulokinase